MRRHAVVLACLPLLAAAPPRSAAAASALADDLDALSQLLSRAEPEAAAEAARGGGGLVLERMQSNEKQLKEWEEVKKRFGAMEPPKEEGKDGEPLLKGMCMKEFDLMAVKYVEPELTKSQPITFDDTTGIVTESLVAEEHENENEVRQIKLAKDTQCYTTATSGRRTAREAKAAGYKPDALMAAGYTLSEIIEAEYTRAEYEEADKDKTKDKEFTLLKLNAAASKWQQVARLGYEPKDVMEAKVDALFGDKAEAAITVEEWILLDFSTHFKPGEYKVAPSSMGATSMTGNQLRSEDEVEEKRKRFAAIRKSIQSGSEFSSKATLTAKDVKDFVMRENNLNEEIVMTTPSYDVSSFEASAGFLKTLEMCVACFQTDADSQSNSWQVCKETSDAVFAGMEKAGVLPALEAAPNDHRRPSAGPLCCGAASMTLERDSLKLKRPSPSQVFRWTACLLF